MNIDETITAARDSLTARRVYGDPYERDGVTVIPAASVHGGGGGGGNETERGSDGGGGFGLIARPVGAYVIRDGEVSWQPAFDLTRTILGCQLLGLAALVLTHVRLRKRR
jgi:uncharacterized spore protein YtfJ